jgi:methylated-DNA-[protein]-cysteine S-methyltransferase
MIDISKIKTEEDIRKALEGYSDFLKEVYVAASKIPKGKVSTYGRIAKMIGRPGAYRAVANAMHNNPLFPVVPCHRVVKEDGSFGGPAAAAHGRRQHCVEEGVPIVNGKVRMTPDILF